MLRDLRPGDAPRVIEFLRTGFPAEEAILGSRPDGVAKIIRRVFRLDTRLLLGLLRAVGRPAFRFFVVDDGGRIVGTTILAFPEEAGYVSMVVVDPAVRRRGHAKALLEAARVTTVRRGRPFIALDVLESNAPARALYESIGYRPLRATGMYARDLGTDPAGPVPSVPGIRAFTARDAAPLAAIAQADTPPEVTRVLPVRARDLIGGSWVDRVMATTSAAWVVDRGAGPEAYLTASHTPATEAGHLGTPIIAASADPAAVQALVATAVAWLAEQKVPRIAGMVPAANSRGRAALEAAAFHHAISILTLYRPSA